MFLRIFLILLFVLSFTVVPCHASRLNFFLNIVNPTSDNIVLKIKNISVSVNNETHVLRDFPQTISSRVNFGQTFLGWISFEKGIISQVTLVLDEVSINDKVLPIEKTKITLPVDYKISSKKSVCFFVLWDVKASLKSKKFIPIFSLNIQRVPQRGDNLYISSDDSSTIFVVRTDINRVVGSLYVPPEPKSLDIDRINDQLIVVSDKLRLLSIIDISSFCLVDSFVLPMVDSPQYLSFVSRNLVVVTDPVTSNILLLDIPSGNLLVSKRLGYSPSDILFDSNLNKIFVSSPKDQSVYILSKNLDLLNKIKVGQSPRGMAILGKNFYVADPATGMVDVFRIDSWSHVGRILSGRGAVKVFSYIDRIYVSNEKEGTISVIFRDQMAASKKIRVGKQPFDMIASSKRGWLYVALRGEKAIGVIDLNSLKLIGKISLGCKPFDLILSE
ncbi:hypothetical protein Thein_1800 [Thermodesulfatator indicus DSM 15286]|uniref:YncE family protein n=1 Tax=Thermodesulfatator indicus (strain DSM 15286 / JCM 11887 / CIR29812) TaxID=667014 RepID=F8ABW4_THEID|nr:YncE family protein [Thermodesulfatator indicus]AEH45656.1 hypothetical protein Thein_1800 [Thermodesulfatator indicus DSM 15286]